MLILKYFSTSCRLSHSACLAWPSGAALGQAGDLQVSDSEVADTSSKYTRVTRINTQVYGRLDQTWLQTNTEFVTSNSCGPAWLAWVC